MKKFLLLYVGPATPMEEMSKEASDKANAGWQAWMDRVGKALIDVGSPTANGQAVVDDGSDGTASLVNGYSIVQAEDMDGAKELVEDHPFLSDKNGKFQVEVFEIMPMPM